MGAVEFGDGNILLLGSLTLDAHVELNGNKLEGHFEHGVLGDWFIGFGNELQVFRDYAKLLGDRFGLISRKIAPRVWCSWYSFYVAIDEPILFKVFEEFGDTPFDVLQVDDGWQQSIGDWDVNHKFPSGMTKLADKIKSTGRTAGLWLAPLIAVQSSNLFKSHSDWFLKNNQGEFVSAGFNWGEQLYALDVTIPAVLEFLKELMKKVRSWGFDYIKLDFLYAGALPGKRYTNTPREVAYRQGLTALRESMGDAYFLTCGAPIMPSIGLCDAMRVGPDVAAEWENYRDAQLFYNPTTPGVKNAIRTTINRYWLSDLLECDPDVVYFRSAHNTMTVEEKRLLQDLALVTKFKATSDVPKWLSESERNELNTFFNYNPAIIRESRNRFKIDDRQVDFSSGMSLPPIPRGVTAVKRAVIGSVSNQKFVLEIFNRLFKISAERAKADM